MQFACKRRVLASSLISGQICGALNVPQDAEIWPWTHCLTDVIIVYSTYPKILTTKTNWSSNDTSFLFFKYERSIHLHFFPTDKQKKWNIRVVVVWYKNVRVYVLRSFCCCYQRNKRLCAHFSRTNDNFSSHILHIVDIVNMRIIIYPMLKCRLFFFSCSWEIRATIWCTVYITNAHRIFMHNTGCDSAWMCSYQNVGVCVHVHVWRKEI